MPDYLTIAQARAELGVSAFLFNKNFRPQLTEIPRGERTVLFDRLEVERLKGESDPMWNNKKVRDALDHTWETRWQFSRDPFKKESLKDKVVEEIGNDRLSRLDAARLDEWVHELRDRDLSPDTIKSRLSCLRVALRGAVRKGWMKQIPEFPEIESTERVERYLRDEPNEEAMLHEACGCLGYKDCDVMRLVIVFMADTGCRVSELTRLRWKDLAHGRAIFERRKGKKKTYKHSVKLTTRAQNAINALLENDHWMLHVRGTDKSETRRRTAQSWLTHRFTTVRDHAGLKDVSLHTLRHTCCSRLVQAGVPLYEVSKFLGHSSITVTERYAHLAPNTDDRAASVLENRSLPNKVTKMRGPSH